MLYWAFSTLTTAGYGDVTAKTVPELLWACIVMFLGVYVREHVRVRE